MAKILLVEDDKSLREIYGVRLMAEGYEIVSAGDGEEALAMAIKERPDLIVSDVMMPKISGFDMLDILRSTSETKGVKVIMMTALSSDDQRARGEALGADRYLVKSQVGIEDVVRTVHDVLGDSIAQAAPAAPSFGPTPMPVNAAPAPEVAPQAVPTPEPVVSAPELPTPPTPDVAPEAPAVAPPAPAPFPPAPEAAPEAPAPTPEAETTLEFEETPGPEPAPVPQTDSAYAAPEVAPQTAEATPAPEAVPAPEPAPISAPSPVPEPEQQPATTTLSELPTPPTPTVAPEAPAVVAPPAPFPPAPAVAPEAPGLNQAPQAPPVFNPAPEAPAPAPFAPAPKTMAPGPDSALPLPTAPFSTPAPASLGQRVIEPLTQPQATNSGNDIASQIAQELNTTGTPPVPPAS